MTEKRHSYGIIPLYKSEQGIEVLLVQHVPETGGHWSFPKGTPEGDETPLETARREVFEETGVTFEKIDEAKTFSEDYTFEREKKSIEKTTTYFIGWVQDQSYLLQEDEIQAGKWLPLREAEEKLTYPETKQLFANVREYLKE